MKKYKVELTEEQLRLVADCLEDVSRFASGQCEMNHTINAMVKDLPFEGKIENSIEARYYLSQVKQTLLPNLKEHESLGYNGSDFIGNTYQIYRSILHRLAVENKWDNVYLSPPLKSGNMGTVKVEQIK